LSFVLTISFCEHVSSQLMALGLLKAAPDIGSGLFFDKFFRFT
jgi:hypothetical protein